MNDLDLAEESLQLVKKDLGLEEEANLTETKDPLEELHHFLTRQIQYLIDHDFNRLINAMYRIDISEKKFKQILELSEPGKIAPALSNVIIEREKAKVFTRRKYANTAGGRKM